MLRVAKVALVFAAGLLVVFTGPVSAQTPTGLRDGSVTGSVTAAITPWGDPDLQGIWDFRTATPLQRPADLAGRSVLTPDEAAAYEREDAARRADYDATPTVHAKFWLDYGTKLTEDRRTSLIVEPEDGRIPALTAEAQGRARLRHAARSRAPAGYQDRSLGERCLLSINAGPPMSPGPYNNNVHIVQSPGYVVLLNEMIHDVRVIPLDGRHHLPESIRQTRGDSRDDGSTRHWSSRRRTSPTGPRFKVRAVVCV